MRNDEIEARDLEVQPTVVMVATLPVSEIGAWLSLAYATIGAYLRHLGKEPTGMPFARFHRVSDDRFGVEAGFPVARPLAGDEEIRPSMLPGGPAAAIVHQGPYETVGPAYEALEKWIAAQRAAPDGDPWEVYWSDPATEPDPGKWRTEILQPYRHA